LLLAAVVGSMLARQRGEETAAEAEIVAVEQQPEEELRFWPGEEELRRLESAVSGGFRAESTEG
jgi:hypothetical protein